MRWTLSATAQCNISEVFLNIALGKLCRYSYIFLHSDVVCPSYRQVFDTGGWASRRDLACKSLTLVISVDLPRKTSG